MVGLLPNGRSPRSSRVDQQPWVHVDEKVSGLQEVFFFLARCEPNTDLALIPYESGCVII